MHARSAGADCPERIGHEYIRRAYANPAVRAGAVVTHASCPDCQLRFADAEAAYLVACPSCGELLQTRCSPGEVLGYRLYHPAGAFPAVPEAVAVAMSTPSQHRERP